MSAPDWNELTAALAEVADRVRDLSRTPGPHDGAVDALRGGVDALEAALDRTARADPRDAAEAQYVAQMAVLVLGDVRAAIEQMENEHEHDGGAA